MAVSQPVVNVSLEKRQLDRDQLRWIVQAEHAVIFALVLWLAWPYLKEAPGWAIFWLVLPDLPALGPLGVLAMLRGRAAVRELEQDAQGVLSGRAGELPRWFPPLYNVTHTYLVPAVFILGVSLLTGQVPWLMAGWLLHIAADRALGYTLRRPDGTLC